MTKLEKLYSIIETSREVGVELPMEVLRQVEELEEGIIKEEILPALSSDIAPRLNNIKRDLVLVVEYHPGEPISVALSRKAKISEIMGAKTLTPRSSMPVRDSKKPTIVPSIGPTKHIENSTKGLKVIFPDGTVVWHRQAIDTFISSLRKIGLGRIPVVGIKHGNGYNLVSKDKRPTVSGRIWQHKCDGWYIYSNINNADKIEDLKRISDFYHLGLVIEKGKPKTEILKSARVPISNKKILPWELPVKDQFCSFLLREKPESTAKGYTSTLDSAVRMWINKIVDERADSIFSYTTSGDVRRCIDLLKASPNFVEENKRKHNSMSAALHQYLFFIEEKERELKS